MYVPLEDAGFTRNTISWTAFTFSANASAVNDTLPTGKCQLPALSAR